MNGLKIQFLLCLILCSTLIRRIQADANHTLYFMEAFYTPQFLNETLGSIAEKVYGHENLWSLIYHANKATMIGGNSINATAIRNWNRTFLILPAQDCVRFMTESCLQILPYIDEQNENKQLEMEQVYESLNITQNNTIILTHGSEILDAELQVNRRVLGFIPIVDQLIDIAWTIMLIKDLAYMIRNIAHTWVDESHSVAIQILNDTPFRMWNFMLKMDDGFYDYFPYAIEPREMDQVLTTKDFSHNKNSAGSLYFGLENLKADYFKIKWRQSKSSSRSHMGDFSVSLWSEDQSESNSNDFTISSESWKTQSLSNDIAVRYTFTFAEGSNKYYHLVLKLHFYVNARVIIERRLLSLGDTYNNKLTASPGRMLATRPATVYLNQRWSFIQVDVKDFYDEFEERDNILSGCLIMNVGTGHFVTMSNNLANVSLDVLVHPENPAILNQMWVVRYEELDDGSTVKYIHNIIASDKYLSHHDKNTIDQEWSLSSRNINYETTAERIDLGMHEEFFNKVEDFINEIGGKHRLCSILSWSQSLYATQNNKIAILTEMPLFYDTNWLFSKTTNNDILIQNEDGTTKLQYLCIEAGSSLLSFQTLLLNKSCYWEVLSVEESFGIAYKIFNKEKNCFLTSQQNKIYCLTMSTEIHLQWWRLEAIEE